MIQQLGLAPLPGEGGYYAETYRSIEAWTGQPDGPRWLSTAIYYLLTDDPDSFSAMHRLKGVEVYHFYLGDPVEMLLLDPSGGARQLILGQDLAAGQRVQFAVPGGTWQGSRLLPGGRFALMGTTMAPGFDPRDNEFGHPGHLARLYPAWSAQIRGLTRPGTVGEPDRT